MQKLNLGCGFKKLDGFLNIDINPAVNPDKVIDLEKGKLPFKDNSVEHVTANYIFEYIGEGFLPLMKEIYRVCEPGAILEVLSKHPRHDDFLNDPRHKRPITLNLLKSLGKKYSSWYKDFNDGNLGVADEINVDFEMATSDFMLDDDYIDLARNNKMQEILEISKRFNNVHKAVFAKMVVMKDE